MNWGELKQQIRDLGFEEDSTMDEYQTIVINAANRAIDMVYQELVVSNKEYFGNLYATKKKVTDELTGITRTEKIKWKPTQPDPITEETTADTDIDLPDRVDYIVPLLAAYYVWLDDDQTKAVLYWNQFDDFRQKLKEEAQQRNYDCDMVGGLWF